MKGFRKLSSIAILLCAFVYPPLLAEAKASPVSNSLNEQQVGIEANSVVGKTGEFMIADRHHKRRFDRDSHDRRRFDRDSHDRRRFDRDSHDRRRFDRDSRNRGRVIYRDSWNRGRPVYRDSQYKQPIYIRLH